MQLSNEIDHRAGLTRDQFEQEYLKPLRPVVLTDAIDHWSALGRWSPAFFKTHHGRLKIKVDGEAMTLGELVDRIDASTDGHPAPYLRNQLLSDWPAELRAEVSPMPECTRPNWLESRLFPSRTDLSSVEVYIGGMGAKFPVLHYDNWHTHAFLMQLYGEKEYVAFSPDQGALLYPRLGIGRNNSQINDPLKPDLDSFPLCDRAEGIRFRLRPGETLFVPAGWWHTARILSPSVTVSINTVNRANAAAFRHDYVESIAGRSRLRSWVAAAALYLGETTWLFERL
jgi:histone arginine demethylase JMJD6